MVTVIDPLGPDRKDTRGLPEGYDPHMLYEYRFQRLKEEATGLEWYLHKYIPYSLIKSFAIAIDPTSKFKVAPGVITPENRTKWRQTASVLQQGRSVQNKRVVTEYHQLVNYYNISGCRSPYVVSTNNFTDSYTTGAQSQAPLVDYLKDTTSRTRLMGSSQGTLTMMKGYINSPPRTVSDLYSVSSTFTANAPPPNDPCTIAGGTGNAKDGGTENKYSTIGPTAATLSLSTCTSLRNSEINYNVQLSQKHVLAMLKEYTPNKRDYTLFRNLAELRDLPRSIMQLQNTAGELRKLFVSLQTSPSLRKRIFDLGGVAKQVPNEYLSYHFGWKQLYKDIEDLLAAPEKIQKRFNLLLKRSGKPTTFRVKRSFVSGESGVSGFNYDTSPYEFDTSSSSRIERSSELRLVVNATFDFPPVCGVRFLYDQWIDRIGVVPRVTDVYNLVPWSWLVDYFTGLGNYIECIEVINKDEGLINWGLITCVTEGKLITDFKSKSKSVSRIYANNVQVGNSEITRENRHTSVYNYKCETRRDVATILDVNCTSDPVSLSDYQKSIIGALLAQRIFPSKGPGFNPRS
jgi:hypothetical protein